MSNLLPLFTKCFFVSCFSIWVQFGELFSWALSVSWDVAGIQVFSVVSNDSASFWAVPVLTSMGVVTDVSGTLLEVSLGHVFWENQSSWNTVGNSSNLFTLVFQVSIVCSLSFSSSLCVSLILGGLISSILFVLSKILFSGPVVQVVLRSSFLFLLLVSILKWSDLNSASWSNKACDNKSQVFHSR